MAINISLYQVTDDIHVMGKNIGTAVATHQITLKEGCSVDRPVVSFSAEASAIAPLNYAYIDTFQRYYYIVDRNSLMKGVVELTLESDPLESFQAELRACPATITRQEDRKKADAYLVDGKYIGKAYQQLTTRDFPKSLDDFSYILMCVG